MKKYTVMLVEDSEKTQTLLHRFLTKQGFDVVVAESAIEAFQLLHSRAFDITLLDISLPDYDGYEVCKAIRQKCSIPIIFLSAFSDVEYILRAYKFGADDYVTKPFNLDVLVAKIWAVLKRSTVFGSQMHLLEESNVKKGHFRFDETQKVIYFNDRLLDFTTLEFKIMEYFVRHPNQIVTRDELIYILDDPETTYEKVNFHIKNIRKKIGENPKFLRYLHSIYGKGYRFLPSGGESV